MGSCEEKVVAAIAELRANLLRSHEGALCDRGREMQATIISLRREVRRLRCRLLLTLQEAPNSACFDTHGSEDDFDRPDGALDTALGDFWRGKPLVDDVCFLPTPPIYGADSMGKRRTSLQVTAVPPHSQGIAVPTDGGTPTSFSEPAGPDGELENLQEHLESDDHHILMWPVWKEHAETHQNWTAWFERISLTGMLLDIPRDTEFLIDINDDGEAVVQKDASLQRANTLLKLTNNCNVRLPVLHPSSRLRLGWDCLGIPVLGLDFVLIPLSAFALPDMSTVDLATLAFWTIDMIMSLITGYVTSEGQIICKHKLIALHYLKTWFPLDFFIVGIDWLLFFAASEAHAGLARLGKFTRIIRIMRVLRMIRLVRLAKLRNLIQRGKDRLDSEFMSVVFSMMKNLMLIVAMNHFIACAWYALGVASRGVGGEGEENPAWVDAYHMDATTVYDQYVTSYHWSITQFTPGSMHMQPQNALERSFAIVVLLFAMVIVSSFVSSITNAMSALRNLTSRRSSQFWMLRRYLRDHKISSTLSTRVKRYLSIVSIRQQQRVQHNSVELLLLLSGPLHVELQTELFERHLIDPFFRCFRTLADTTPVVRHICTDAVSTCHYCKYDSIFHFEQKAAALRFVIEGMVLFTLIVEGKEVSCQEAVGPSQWLTEAVLWVPWSHCGLACTASDTYFVVVAQAKFHETMRLHPREFRFAQAFAENYVRKLNERPRNEPLTDMPLYGVPLPEQAVSWVSTGESNDVRARHVIDTFCEGA